MGAPGGSVGPDPADVEALDQINFAEIGLIPARVRANFNEVELTLGHYEAVLAAEQAMPLVASQDRPHVATAAQNLLHAAEPLTCRCRCRRRPPRVPAAAASVTRRWLALAPTLAGALGDIG